MTLLETPLAAELSPLIVDGPSSGTESSALRLRKAVADGAGFGLIDASTRMLTMAALARHADLDRGPSRLTLIAPPRDAPLDDRRSDEELFSFLATPDLAARIDFDTPLETWCYQLMHSVLADVRLGVDVAVVHKDAPTPRAPKPWSPVDVIIPHRGREQHLRLCVDSVLRQDAATRIVVGLDQKARCTRLLKDLQAQPSASVYQLDPSPAGPYVVRHHLGHAAKCAYMLGQDSDDVSVGARLAMLLAASAETGAGIVGSHELCVQEVRRQVLAVRYPLDASAAIDRIGAGHQVLFPATLVRRDVFEAVGGFSTDKIFSLDVNFWLAASLLTEVRNVDEFLYIRRRRAGSLTMRRDIGNQSRIRRRIRDQRTSEFAAVREGRLALADSVLALRHRPGPVAFRRLKPADDLD